jgi:hypothetical protein
MAKEVRSEEWAQFAETVKQDNVTLQVMSYQNILSLAQDVTRGNKTEGQVWTELAEWVDRKIAATRTNVPAASTIC